MTAAILEAGKWIDASLGNKNKMAETMADKSYVNTSVDAINQRILGRYQNGMGKTWDDPNYMKFSNDGAVNFPYLSDGMWFLTQHKRWGSDQRAPGLPGRGQADQPDRHLQASRHRRQVSLPKDAMRSSKLMDGVVWDGKDPEEIRRRFQDQGLSSTPRLDSSDPPDKQKGPAMVSAVFHNPLGDCERLLSMPRPAIDTAPACAVQDRAGQGQPASQRWQASWTRGWLWQACLPPLLGLGLLVADLGSGVAGHGGSIPAPADTLARRSSFSATRSTATAPTTRAWAGTCCRR